MTKLTGEAMKFIPSSSQKNRARRRGPRISISQDEITADLNYRGGESRRPGTVTPIGRGRR